MSTPARIVRRVIHDPHTGEPQTREVEVAGGDGGLSCPRCEGAGRTRPGCVRQASGLARPAVFVVRRDGARDVAAGVSTSEWVRCPECQRQWRSWTRVPA